MDYRKGWPSGCGRLITLMAALLIGHLSAAAKSIFDDDWQPPTSRPVTVVPTPIPPPVSPPPRAPAAPGNSDPVPRPPADSITPPIRRPVPSAAQLVATRRTFREVYKTELTDRSATAQRALAQKLLADAATAGSVPTDQFVLLAGAREAGTEAGDLSICLRASDRLEQLFVVDGLQYKVDSAIRSPLKGATSSDTLQNCRAALEIVDELIEVRDYVSALKVLTPLKAAASTLPALSAEVRDRAKVVQDLQIAVERIKPQLARLQTDPSDRAANLAVGRVACLLQGDWGAGLPAMAKGSDDGLRALAAKELGGPSSAADFVTLGDGWWNQSGKETGTAHIRALRHAADLYEHARAIGLQGLQQTVVEKRLTEANHSPGVRRIINLMHLIDVKRDGVSGDWEFDGVKLYGHNGPRLRIPYQVPDEYDFHIVFTGVKASSGPSVAQILTRNGHDFAWLNRFKPGTFNAFAWVDGKEGSDGARSPNTQAGDGVGETRDSLVQVRKTFVAAYINGQLAVRYDTNFSELSLRDDLSIGGGAIGLRCNDLAGNFQTIELIEISGKGSIVVRDK